MTNDDYVKGYAAEQRMMASVSVTEEHIKRVASYECKINNILELWAEDNVETIDVIRTIIAALGIEVVK